MVKENEEQEEGEKVGGEEGDEKQANETEGGGENEVQEDGGGDDENEQQQEEQEDQEEENNGEEEEDEDEDKNEEVSDNPYDRMVRSLTNRGSNKRKVKLIENQLAHFVFAESDSEDDEDYTVGDEEMASDDDDDDGGDGGGDEEGSDGSSNEGDGGKAINLLDLLRSYESRGGSKKDASDEDSGNEQQPAEEEEEAKEDPDDMDVNYDENIDFEYEYTAVDNRRPDLKGVKRDDILRSNRQYKKDVLVCGVCLESDENEGDEIVECDNCGITVHEGCYGDFDLDYDNKSVSDDLTEPWFCEPCKSDRTDETELICELCPTKGGVFKETDTGRWVHLICALYTPYVGFRDVIKLQVIVLEDIKKEMWGKKECAFCCDDNFSKTGVCIVCDAGLCRTTFHVTCGQRNGFLSDIPDKTDKNDEMADFLFAHCKLHTVKLKLKKRKTSWLAFQARVSKFKHSDDPEEKARIVTALEYARLEYKTFRRDLIPAKQLPQEFPRLLSSCPEVCMMLSRKAELLELEVEPSYSISAAIVSGKISKHEANLSEDFVNYFFKREMQMKELQQSINQGEPNAAKFQDQQKMLMKKSEMYHSKLEKVQHLKASLMQSCQDIHDLLCKLAGKNLKPPSILRAKHADLMNEKMEQSTQLLNSIIHRCETCKSTDDQHLLALCGTCSRYYHMNCVDPPLSRLPRKSDRYVWQCSSCDPSDKEVSDSEGPITVLVKDEHGVVRRKRPNKEPDKYNPENPKEKKEKKEGESNDKVSKETEPEALKEKKEKKVHKRKTIDEEEAKAKKRKVLKKEDEKLEPKPELPERTKLEPKPERLECPKLEPKPERPERTKLEPKPERPERTRSTDREKKKESAVNISTDKVKVEDDKVKEKESAPKKKKTQEPKVSDCFVCKTIGDPKLLVKCDECGKCYHFLTCINPPYPRNPKVNKYWAWICEECDNSDEPVPTTEEKRVSTKPLALGIKTEDPKDPKADKSKSSSTDKPTRRRESRENSPALNKSATKSGGKATPNVNTNTRVVADLEKVLVKPVLNLTKCTPGSDKLSPEGNKKLQASKANNEKVCTPNDKALPDKVSHEITNKISSADNSRVKVSLDIKTKVSKNVEGKHSTATKNKTSSNDDVVYPTATLKNEDSETRKDKYPVSDHAKSDDTLINRATTSNILPVGDLKSTVACTTSPKLSVFVQSSDISSTTSDKNVASGKKIKHSVSKTSIDKQLTEKEKQVSPRNDSKLKMSNVASDKITDKSDQAVISQVDDDSKFINDEALSSTNGKVISVGDSEIKDSTNSNSSTSEKILTSDTSKLKSSVSKEGLDKKAFPADGPKSKDGEKHVDSDKIVCPDVSKLKDGDNSNSTQKVERDDNSKLEDSIVTNDKSNSDKNLESDSNSKSGMEKIDKVSVSSNENLKSQVSVASGEKPSDTSEKVSSDDILKPKGVVAVSGDISNATKPVQSGIQSGETSNVEKKAEDSMKLKGNIDKTLDVEKKAELKDSPTTRVTSFDVEKTAPSENSIKSKDTMGNSDKAANADKNVQSPGVLKSKDSPSSVEEIVKSGKAIKSNDSISHSKATNADTNVPSADSSKSNDSTSNDKVSSNSDDGSLKSKDCPTSSDKISKNMDKKEDSLKLKDSIKSTDEPSENTDKNVLPVDCSKSKESMDTTATKALPDIDTTKTSDKNPLSSDKVLSIDSSKIKESVATDSKTSDVDKKICPDGNVISKDSTAGGNKTLTTDKKTSPSNSLKIKGSSVGSDKSSNADKSTRNNDSQRSKDDKTGSDKTIQKDKPNRLDPNSRSSEGKSSMEKSSPSREKLDIRVHSESYSRSPVKKLFHDGNSKSPSFKPSDKSLSSPHRHSHSDRDRDRDRDRSRDDKDRDRDKSRDDKDRDRDKSRDDKDRDRDRNRDDRDRDRDRDKRYSISDKHSRHSSSRSPVSKEKTDKSSQKTDKQSHESEKSQSKTVTKDVFDFDPSANSNVDLEVFGEDY